MKNILQKINNSYKKITVILFLFIVSFFIFNNSVLAEGTAGAVSDIASKVGGVVFGAIGGVVAIIMGVIASMITSMIGLLITVLIKILVDVATFNNIIDVPPVIQGWVIIRDLANMFFVLIFLIIAFSTILRIEDGKYNMKMIPKLLIMAVIVNFSRTIFGLMIDFSTLVMLTFASAFNGYGYFVTIFRIDNWLSFPKGQELTTEQFSGGVLSNMDTAGVNQWTTVLAIIASVVAAIMVFIVVATILAVLVMRVIFLWIYTILSPLVFLGWAFAPLQKYTNQIWEDFIKQLIVGPVLAFFLWLALFTMQGEAFKGTSSWLGALNGTMETSNAAVCAGSAFFCNKDFMRFLLSIGLMLGGLMTAQQVGGQSSKIVGSGKVWADKAIKRATSITTGSAKDATEFSGRYAANRLVNSTMMKKVANNDNKGMFGRLARVGTAINKESYDGYKKNNIKKVQGVMEKVMGADGAQSFMNEYADRPLFAGFRVKEKATVDEAKAERDRKKKEAKDRLDMATGPELKKKTEAEKIQLERRSAEEDRLEKERNRKKKESEDNFVRSTNKILSIDEIDKLKKDRDIELAKIDKDYESAKEKVDGNHNLMMKKINDDYEGATESAHAGYRSEDRAIDDEYRAKVDKIGNEEARNKKLDAEHDKYFDSNGVLKPGMTQEGYNDAVKPINNQHDKYYKDGFKPGNVVIEAAKNIAKEHVNADKERDALASGGSDIMDYKKGELYSPKGLSSSQKKFLDSVASGNDKSLMAINSIVSSLTAVNKELIRNGKLEKNQLSTLHGLKQALASREKAGGDNSIFKPVINIIDGITTGDGSKPEHKFTVAQMKDKVV